MLNPKLIQYLERKMGHEYLCWTCLDSKKLVVNPLGWDMKIVDCPDCVTKQSTNGP